MKTKLIICTIGFLGLFQIAEASPVVGGVLVDEKRDRATVTFRNMTNKEVYCEDIRVDYKVIGYEFNEPIGEFSEMLGSAYLKPNQEMIFTDRAQELNRFHTKNRKAVLGIADGNFSNCRVVNFNDYCNYAEKDQYEAYTLSRVMEAAKTGRCEDVEANLNGKLKLSKSGIFNLKPISFLTSLQDLRLAKNLINSVSELSTLKQLVEIDVSDNASLKEVDSLMTLPNIKIIDASHTGLVRKSYKVPGTLKKFYVRGTPYAEGVKQKR